MERQAPGGAVGEVIGATAEAAVFLCEVVADIRCHVAVGGGVIGSKSEDEQGEAAVVTIMAKGGAQAEERRQAALALVMAATCCASRGGGNCRKGVMVYLGLSGR